jgi:beta-phosphoglucomutase-like phosphatase (HAD superfamily)
MKEKDQVGADIYIEDSHGNIESLRARGFYTICFVNSTNKHIEDPRAQDWDDVYKLIKGWK